MRRRVLLCLPLLLCVASATAARNRPPVWLVDPVHTRVAIAVDHAGFSRSLAAMSVTSGRLWWDADAPSTSRVDIQLTPARLDFGDSRWNQAVHGPQVLDVARHPDARFVSREVSQREDGSLVIDGVLTLRGMDVPVQLNARLNGQRRHPMPPFRQTVGFSATGELSRAAFGITAWPTMVGDRIQLQIELEATLDRNAGPETPSAATP